MTAYATAADLLKRYDARTVGDLCSDSGLRVSSAQLPSDPNLAAALDDASGEIDASILHGKIYSAADLSALTGNSRNHLVRICCEIAFGLLWERRPYNDSEQRQEAMDRSRRQLERLRRGEVIFDVDANKEAGAPEAKTPTVSQITRANLIVDACRPGYYPARRLPY